MFVKQKRVAFYMLNIKSSCKNEDISNQYTLSIGSRGAPNSGGRG